MNTAQLVKENISGYRNRADLYRVNPPIKGWDNDKSYSYVLLMTGLVFGSDCWPWPLGPRYETLAFPANKNGVLTGKTNLPISRLGVTSHQQIFANAGYTVVNA